MRDICSNRNWSDLEYEDDVFLGEEDPNKLQVFLDHLNNCMFRIFVIWNVVAGLGFSKLRPVLL